jgi:hypothetical protein
MNLSHEQTALLINLVDEAISDSNIDRNRMLAALKNSGDRSDINSFFDNSLEGCLKFKDLIKEMPVNASFVDELLTEQFNEILSFIELEIDRFESYIKKLKSLSSKGSVNNAVDLISVKLKTVTDLRNDFRNLFSYL